MKLPAIPDAAASPVGRRLFTRGRISPCDAPRVVWSDVTGRSTRRVVCSMYMCTVHVYLLSGVDGLCPQATHPPYLS